VGGLVVKSTIVDSYAVQCFTRVEHTFYPTAKVLEDVLR
jgi:hypothetical protein